MVVPRTICSTRPRSKSREASAAPVTATARSRLEISARLPCQRANGDDQRWAALRAARWNFIGRTPCGWRSRFAHGDERVLVGAAPQAATLEHGDGEAHLLAARLPQAQQRLDPTLEAGGDEVADSGREHIHALVDQHVVGAADAADARA